MKATLLIFFLVLCIMASASYAQYYGYDPYGYSDYYGNGYYNGRMNPRFGRYNNYLGGYGGYYQIPNYGYRWGPTGR
jgi:hypothetical protein